MTHTGIIGLVLIVANIAISYKGFTNDSFFEGYKFEVDKITLYKDYKRLITSGFLHVSWGHLVFNMLSLYAFSGLIEGSVGEIRFLVIYFASLVGGNLLTLFIHRNHGDYSAVGASGAVCGIIFAVIALFPGMGIGFFFLPISIPSWLFGILYIAISVYGIRSGKDNIGHEAHLGGALIGMAAALLMYPSALINNLWTVLFIAMPTIAFVYLIITRPHILLIDNLFFKTHKNYYSIDHQYNEQMTSNHQEIDRILDKINRTGMNSLTQKEKDQLQEYSRSSH
jgi:membrane associated rhomboid family serine protease